MALKKKNVFQGFMPDDYVPSGDQQIVKYLLGKIMSYRDYNMSWSAQNVIN